MSKPVSPLAIGSFLVGGLVLLVLAIMVFGNGQFFKPKIHWVVYFDSSLNGLNVGAPVKVQGVQVGIVKEIQLQLDSSGARLWKPVVLELEPGRLANLDGSPVVLPLTSAGRIKMMDELIATGMKARLEVQSILTSLLYVDLDFIRDQPVILTGLHYNDLPEVPAVPTRVDELMVTVAEIAKKINKMPLESLVKDMADAVSDLKMMLGSEETQRARIALAEVLERTNALMLKLDKDVPGLLKNVNAASVGLRSTSDETLGLVKDFRSQTVPLIKTANQALENASETLWNVRELTGESSELKDAITQISVTSRSLRELTDLLERHPDALLLGRPD